MESASSESELDFRERVLKTVKACQQREAPPLVWEMEAAKCVLGTAGLGLPSPELGEVVVSQLCFTNNHPSLWKFLHQALSSGLLYPLHVLSLLTSRVIPHRWSQPGAYRLYLELLSRYVFVSNPFVADACRDKIIKSVDDALQLSQTYKIQVFELGHALVLSFFSIAVCLVDGILDDWGLKSVGDGHNMDVEFEGNPNFKRHEQREQIQTTNSLMALEVLGNLTDDRKAMALLRVVHFNMPEKYDGLLQRMQLLEAHNLSPSNMASASQPLLKLSANIQRALVSECQSNKRQLIGMLTSIASCKPVSCCASEAGRFACWVPLDIYMENAMDGKQFPVTSAVDILAETISTLQVFNGASWHDTFLALWLSALRIERDPLEGPIPHLEARLCVLLSIVPLAIAHVVEDNSTFFAPILSEGTESRYKETGQGEGGIGHSSRKQGLIISLQLLGQYPALLCPPASAVSFANNAAAKAINFISKSSAKNGISSGGCGNSFVKAGGDMRHLIVEACIARNLVDVSAYFWPGYISASVVSQSDPSLLQRSPWSTLMDGAPLTGPLVNALLTTPASCLVEIEKLYHIALNGPEEEKSAAAKILCGASLSRGWNIQEHVVHFVVKLLSPPVPPKFTGTRSHLVDYMPMLSAILFGAASIDTVHILSLHGVVPEVAASLMPLCETFGSLVPASSKKSSTYDETSIYMVFSSAFLFLLRLWKFYRPPLEQCITGRGGAIGSELTLEYLLLLRNSRMQSSDRPVQDKTDSSSNMHILLSDRAIYIDSYPKLRTWYCQNKSCIASTLSGLSIENPVHQVAFKILNLMYGKLTRSGTVSSNSSTPSSNTTSGSPESAEEDASPVPMLSAWEVLEAVPYVLEATLTACAHGRLSPCELTTGLRDLVDFLPASLAAMISYFSAEVTRGIWKPVPMNGKDWPSPAANLISVESEIKEILTAAGVEFPSYSSEELNDLVDERVAHFTKWEVQQRKDLKGQVTELQEELATCKKELTRATRHGCIVVQPRQKKMPEPRSYDGMREVRQVDNFFWYLERYFEALDIDEEEKVQRTVASQVELIFNRLDDLEVDSRLTVLERKVNVFAEELDDLIEERVAHFTKWEV
ncbi:hypothetical protein RJ639_046619 [Escallonia herrerae]|uniref:Mediator of RNA polymerase II transcription subunit 33A n=1 Tax=Escallonia herrerae TaxID=1293975 RepID=A0AA88WES2_9ASTE|nr:hypothetical protein RJ639_046619 [Escallonia herrerae]